MIADFKCTRIYQSSQLHKDGKSQMLQASWSAHDSGYLLDSEHPAVPLFPAEAKVSQSAPPMLSTFYRGSIESILTSCVTMWYWTTVSDHKNLQLIVRTEKIIWVSLPTMDVSYNNCCIGKTISITDGPPHPITHPMDSHPPAILQKLQEHEAMSWRKDSLFQMYTRYSNGLQ